MNTYPPYFIFTADCYHFIGTNECFDKFERTNSHRTKKEQPINIILKHSVIKTSTEMVDNCTFCPIELYCFLI